MLNDLKIRNKLVAILTAPILALLVLAFVGVSQRNSTARRADHDVKIVKVVDASANLIAALNKEGTNSVAAISKYDVAAKEFSRDASFDAQLKAARAQTDKAFDDFDKSIKNIGESSLSEGSRASVEQVRIRKASVETTRAGIDENRGSKWNEVLSSYASAAEDVVTVASALTTETTSPEVVAPLQGFKPFLSYLLTDTVVSDYLVGFTRQGDWEVPVASVGSGTQEATDADKLLTSTSFANKVRARDTAQSILREMQLSNSIDVGKASGGEKLPGAFQLINSAALDASAYPTEANANLTANPKAAQQLVEDALNRTSDLTKIGRTTTTELTETITARKNDSARAAQLFILFAGLVIVIAVVLAIWVARSITQRINKLTVAAERLSHEQLPRLVDSLKNPAEDDIGYLTSSFTEIEVGGNDEIGHLADAFNRIQGVAVEVATEQAQLLRKGIGDMFVNLARRNQGLLDRQIEFIDQLEAAEEDPDQLENLFRLDHLATRMRRNAESLLVLAGAEPNRRRGKPVPLADVVRAAVGEVEDFARIDMLQFDEVLVASNAALDVAHLLSELMENAANFSPPDSRVEVVGHRTKAEGYVISVADHGIGMNPEQLSEFNDLLSRPPLVGLALSRSLGFIVIGRLAGRFGIAVRLMPSPSGGTTAMVSLPPSLITDQPRSSGPGVLEQDSAAPLATAPDDASSIAEATPPAPRASRPPADGAALAADARAAEQRHAGASPPMARRAPGKSAPPPATTAPPAATSASAAQAPVAANDAPAEKTSATGLTKRVPRAAGAKRAVPGSDSERTATKNRRSPEEVRSMLSRYQSGVQRGRSDDASPSTPEDTPS